SRRRFPYFLPNLAAGCVVDRVSDQDLGRRAGGYRLSAQHGPLYRHVQRDGLSTSSADLRSICSEPAQIAGKDDTEMTARTPTFPLRLPPSLKNAVEQVARKERTSVNQFVVTAVAEKISALRTAELFRERKTPADFAAFDRIFSRKGGQRPE